ncbi:MAG: hypothetical protein KAS23_09260 [Anaerohalosphaera sp.]|nr:hypothetical protein [Anaerohalosphaera sp.]
MKSLYMFLLVALMLVISGCGNSDSVSCREQNELLSAKLTQVQGQLEKATKALEACNNESQEVQTKAMEAISTMMMKQKSADDKVKAKLVTAEQKVTKMGKQLEGYKVLGGVLEGKMKEMKGMNTALKEKVAELEGKLTKALKAVAAKVDDN